MTETAAMGRWVDGVKWEEVEQDGERYFSHDGGELDVYLTPIPDIDGWVVDINWPLGPSHAVHLWDLDETQALEAASKIVLVQRQAMIAHDKIALDKEVVADTPAMTPEDRTTLEAYRVLANEAYARLEAYEDNTPKTQRDVDRWDGLERRYLSQVGQLDRELEKHNLERTDDLGDEGVWFQPISGRNRHPAYDDRDQEQQLPSPYEIKPNDAEQDRGYDR